MKKAFSILFTTALILSLCSCSLFGPETLEATIEGEVIAFEDGVCTVTAGDTVYSLLITEDSQLTVIPEVSDDITAHVKYLDAEPIIYTLVFCELTKHELLKATYTGTVTLAGNTLTLHPEDGSDDVVIDISALSELPQDLCDDAEITADVEYRDNKSHLPLPAVSITVIVREPEESKKDDKKNDDDDEPEFEEEPENPYALKDGDVTSKGFKVTVKNGVTYIDGILIANKTYGLPSTYAPGGLTKATKKALEAMNEASAEYGYKYKVVSGYRSYKVQYGLYWGYVDEDGQERADTYSARPGHSEHQTGLTMDVNNLTREWGATDEGIWLAEHCHEFGFIVRYPEGKQSITGYVYEPWHIRYVGVELATILYEEGLTLEEYFGIDSEYYNG